MVKAKMKGTSSCLRSCLTCDPKGSGSRLDAAMIPLLQIHRDMEVYPELPGPQAGAYDVMLSDISPKDLPNEISEVLGVEYLSPSNDVAVWPAIGRVYGTKRRVLFSMPVSIRGIPASAVSVHFIFDTGAPATYLARSTVEALGLKEWRISDAAILVNGIKIGTVLVSDSITITASDGSSQQCHFAGLNVLGMD